MNIHECESCSNQNFFNPLSPVAQHVLQLIHQALHQLTQLTSTLREEITLSVDPIAQAIAANSQTISTIQTQVQSIATEVSTLTAQIATLNANIAAGVDPTADVAALTAQGATLQNITNALQAALPAATTTPTTTATAPSNPDTSATPTA